MVTNEHRDRSWYEFENYLHQDVLWPSSTGVETSIESMAPVHALRAYRILREAGEFATLEAAVTPLGQALRAQALGHRDKVVADPIARLPRGQYLLDVDIPVSYVYEALEVLEEAEATRITNAHGEMHPVDRATLVQRHITRRLTEDQQ